MRSPQNNQRLASKPNFSVFVIVNQPLIHRAAENGNSRKLMVLRYLGMVAFDSMFAFLWHVEKRLKAVCRS
jgi:hypothetical protein